jgi:tetratricopeptide (TPR) repeat protein
MTFVREHAGLLDVAVRTRQEQHVDQLSAHLDRGWDLAHRGDAAGAQLCGQRALELEPEAPEVHNLLGFAAAMAGETDDALEHYRQAMALDENYFEAMLNAGELMVTLGDFDDAAALCEDALQVAETDEERVDCLLLCVDAALGKGDERAAKATLARLPNGPFEDPQTALLVGRAHFEGGQKSFAKPFLDDAYARDPQNADAAYYLALFAEDAGDERQMTELFLKTRSCDSLRAPPPWAPLPEAFGASVRQVLSTLDSKLAPHVREAEIFVVDLPGAEVVVDGVDPRALVLIERSPEGDRARIFVYQRNVERAAGMPAELENALQEALSREVDAVFSEQNEPPHTHKKIARRDLN